ncbi:TonB-linked SusC/RagA family outer membrane protein [Catalinimonas alkaloidigena]|uniref:SusC/RagA family TonB-linked outer membrane protein n=1 Tax=Catalinimonas alkaloidigena TaxID=1075417 RepID=UPI0024074449|nr:TonB-dependent receptor [Catalinimonas alkaloidigena]MDF9796963.1 TonB-linked SusC/RagA family outer membrane protein [Catalinimonas alkaloidigena]
MKSSLHYRLDFLSRLVLVGFVLLSVFSSMTIAKNLHFNESELIRSTSPKIPENVIPLEISISGKVTDENGHPLPGVSVLEKGTTKGTITDIEGDYTLSVTNENSILIFTFVGYSKKEVAIGSSLTLDVQLELDSKQLEEIVVVGYGTQKKSEVTNAVVQTTGEEIKKSPAVSLSNSLAGRMAGLYVNQRSSVPGFDDAQILVRGFNTYRDNSALIVIDGVANADPDGLNRLDPNDIESISVLKDASAAIYGAQSAGGVILVTTKRGKVGKPTFSYTGSQAYQSPTSKVNTADALEYMGVLNSSRALDGTDPDFPDELIESYRNGTLRSEDWWDALIDAPVPQGRHSLTMRGGTDKIKYFTSVGTAFQGGILIGDDKTKLRQYNVRSNLDLSVADNLNVGLDLSLRQKYTQTPQTSPGGDLHFAVQTSPLREAFIDGDTRYPSEGWSHLNPAARVHSPGYRKYTANVINGTFRYNYDIPFIDGLFLDGFASLVKVVNYDKSFNYIWDYYEKNTEGEIIRKDSRTVEDIGLREDFYQSQRITLNTKLNYNTTINEKHNLSTFIAYEQMEYSDNYFWTERLGFDSPQIDQLFAGSTNRSNWNNDGGASESSRQNFFGRVTYDFNYKYLFGFNFRYDGSPIFPEETRWGFFPGVSAGWVVSEEEFMPDLFSNLKLRASWGQTGNDRVDPFQYIGIYSYSDGTVIDGVDARGIAATTTPNPNITWEVSENTDIGLELGFLEGRLNFEVDVFKIRTTNILGQRQASIPAYTGLILPDENIGEMENKGIEFQAAFRQNFEDFTFRAQGNVSYNKNTIIYFDEVPQAEPYQKLEGMPFGSTLVYKAIGIYRTQDDLDNNVNYNNAGLGELIFADLNDDGVIDGNDRYRFDSNVFPNIQFGLNLGADYKGFDLSILFQGQEGAEWRLDNGFNTSAGGNGLVYVANNSYSLGNINAALPRIRPTGIASEDSDFWYHDVFWVRLRTLELGYTLPDYLLSSLKLTGLRVYFTSQNLFMVYNNLEKFGSGDPEFTNSGKGAQYPNMRTLGFGLNLTF